MKNLLNYQIIGDESFVGVLKDIKRKNYGLIYTEIYGDCWIVISKETIGLKTYGDVWNTLKIGDKISVSGTLTKKREIYYLFVTKLERIENG